MVKLIGYPLVKPIKYGYGYGTHTHTHTHTCMNSHKKVIIIQICMNNTFFVSMKIDKFFFIFSEIHTYFMYNLYVGNSYKIKKKLN